jgi:hypothetical protein
VYLVIFSFWSPDRQGGQTEILDGRYNSCEDRGVRSHKNDTHTSFIVDEDRCYPLFTGVINDGLETERVVFLCVNYH